jgi:hypothetical protein
MSVSEEANRTGPMSVSEEAKSGFGR